MGRINRMKHIIRFALIVFASWLLSFSATITVLYISNEDARDNSSSYADRGGGALLWACETDTGKQTGALYLGITQEEYDRSMHRDVMRHSTILDPGIHLVEPDDIYVKRIADMILSMTESEWYRITAALNFVQSSISYRDDDKVYGGDFIQSPLETLYLKGGDCEDTSILLMSIYLAMGIDAVLLDYDEHVAVGVMYNGKYLFCETVRDSCSPPRYGLEWDDGYPKIRPYETDDLKFILNDGIGKLRDFIRRVTGI